MSVWVDRNPEARKCSAWKLGSKASDHKTRQREPSAATDLRWPAEETRRPQPSKQFSSFQSAETSHKLVGRRQTAFFLSVEKVRGSPTDFRLRSFLIYWGYTRTLLVVSGAFLQKVASHSWHLVPTLFTWRKLRETEIFN